MKAGGSFFATLAAFIAAGCIVLYVLLCKNNVIDYDGNKKRHLTDEYNYAHFSRITAKNYMFNPQLLKAHPLHITLLAGDGLIIPAGWWHWVRSTPYTFAVNFWASEVLEMGTPQNADADADAIAASLPRRLSNVFDHTSLMTVLESYKGPVRVWNSARDVFLEPEIANFKDTRRIRPNEYIISLKGFECTGTLSPNDELLAAVGPHITPPPVLQRLAKSKIEKNVWVAFGNHDTGLHRDDSLGMLVVLKGSKQVTLYPPRDSDLLKPYDLVPRWAATAWPCSLSPNLYTLNAPMMTREEASASFPSARLLYESIASQKNKSALLHFLMLLQMAVDAPLVWGCKLLADGTMRWEVYAYHFSVISANVRNTEASVDLLLDQHPHAKEYVRHPDALLHSYDIANAATIPEMLSGDVHVYKRFSGASVALPVFGEGTNIHRDGRVEQESTYVVGTRAQFAEHYMHFMSRLGFEESRARAFEAIVLQNYSACPMLCVHNKHDGNVFVQYLGISTAEFGQFLNEFSYPSRLCTHIAHHAVRYGHTPHEITIVFHGETRAPVRTAFYGTLTPFSLP